MLLRSGPCDCARRLALAQDAVKKAVVSRRPRPKFRTKTDAPQGGDAAKKAETAKDDAAKKDAGKTEPAKAAEPPLPPIPPEVQAKIDAARKAVAEAIVAAQDAGLIETLDRPAADPRPLDQRHGSPMLASSRPPRSRGSRTA